MSSVSIVGKMPMLEDQEPKLPVLFRPLGGACRLSWVLELGIHHSSAHGLGLRQCNETTAFCAVFFDPESWTLATAIRLIRRVYLSSPDPV